MQTQPPITLKIALTRRYLAVLAGSVALSFALAWLVFERQIEERSTALIVQHQNEADRSVAAMSATMDRALNRLQGVAAVMADMSDVHDSLAVVDAANATPDLPPTSRKAEWTQAPGLAALNRRLSRAAHDIGVDVIWVMNAAGDCIAASNSAEASSFIATNYADRQYFKAAQGGTRGRQYAMGRVTRIPGLFFSAPVTVGGRFMGAVAVKNNLPRLASTLNHPNAFVTDDYGVVILASDKRIEMRALPGAAVHQLPADRQLSRYARQQFESYGAIEEASSGSVVRIAGSSHTHVAARSELPQHGVTVHVLMPISGADELRRDAIVTALLLASLGLLATALGFGTYSYVSQMRQYRSRLERANESLTRLNAQLSDLSTRDPLTGLYNRRFMDETLEREVARAHRKHKPLAMIMIDIDHFKSLNDAFGHAAGDAVLRAAGDVMTKHVRAVDAVCRYGGEEFLVVMPEASPQIARERAEALRVAFHDLSVPFDAGTTRRITVSMGLSMLPEHGTRVADLVTAADAALYEAKRTGRDRLVIAGETHDPSAVASVG